MACLASQRASISILFLSALDSLVSSNIFQKLFFWFLRRFSLPFDPLILIIRYDFLSQETRRIVIFCSFCRQIDYDCCFMSVMFLFLFPFLFILFLCLLI